VALKEAEKDTRDIQTENRNKMEAPTAAASNDYEDKKSPVKRTLSQLFAKHNEGKADEVRPLCVHSLLGGV
jgi:hypothetical protein